MNQGPVMMGSPQPSYPPHPSMNQQIYALDPASMQYQERMQHPVISPVPSSAVYSDSAKPAKMMY